MKPTGRKISLLIWPTGFPEGQKEEGAPERPFILRVPEYDYAEPLTQYDIDDLPEGYTPEPELGIKLSDIYKPLQTGIVERVQVQLSEPSSVSWMWVDEEGHVRRRAINLWATELYWKARASAHPIAGTVAVELLPGTLLKWPDNFGPVTDLETKELT